MARAARAAAAGDPATLVVTASLSLSPRTLERAGALGVDRLVTFVGSPLVDQVRALAPLVP